MQAWKFVLKMWFNIDLENRLVWHLNGSEFVSDSIKSKNIFDCMQAATNGFLRLKFDREIKYKEKTSLKQI